MKSKWIPKRDLDIKDGEITEGDAVILGDFVKVMLDEENMAEFVFENVSGEAAIVTVTDSEVTMEVKDTVDTYFDVMAVINDDFDDGSNNDWG